MRTAPVHLKLTRGLSKRYLYVQIFGHIKNTLENINNACIIQSDEMLLAERICVADIIPGLRYITTYRCLTSMAAHTWPRLLKRTPDPSTATATDAALPNHEAVVTCEPDYPSYDTLTITTTHNACMHGSPSIPNQRSLPPTLTVTLVVSNGPLPHPKISTYTSGFCATANKSHSHPSYYPSSTCIPVSLLPSPLHLHPSVVSVSCVRSATFAAAPANSCQLSTTFKASCAALRHVIWWCMTGGWGNTWARCSFATAPPVLCST